MRIHAQGFEGRKGYPRYDLQAWSLGYAAWLYARHGGHIFVALLRSISPWVLWSFCLHLVTSMGLFGSFVFGTLCFFS